MERPQSGSVYTQARGLPRNSMRVFTKRFFVMLLGLSYHGGILKTSIYEAFPKISVFGKGSTAAKKSAGINQRF
jgi:hypothetical protein